MGSATHSFGQLAPLVLLFLGGLLCSVGAALGWEWLYPGRGRTRHWSAPLRRTLLLIMGLAVMGIAVTFYFSQGQPL